MKLFRLFRPLHLLLVPGLCLAPVPLLAHRVSSVSLISYLDTKGRTYTLDAAMEVVPSEDPTVNDQISPEDAAREFAGYLNVMFDEAQQKPEMEITVEETSDQDTPEELRRRQVLTKLRGKIPGGAKEFLLYLDPRCPMAVVMVVVKDQQPSRRMQVILAGEYSRPVSVLPVEEGDPFKEAPSTGSPPVPAEATTPVVQGDPATAASTTRADSTSGASSRGALARGAFVPGWRAFFHESALPSVVVVGLLLLTLGRKSVLWQLGMLLVFQAVALSLVIWRLMPVPEWAGAVLAGLTALLAIEALFHHQVKAWRYPLVGLAGAASGLFLAGTSAFRELLAGSDLGVGRAIVLLLGVETGVLLVALASASVLLSLSRFEWYRKSVVTPVGVLVAGYAVFTLVERWI
jgi:hypothetical protein